MSPSRSHIDVTPPSSVELDSRDGRELLQQRLALFGLWNGLLSLGFVPVRVLGEDLLGSPSSFTSLMTRPSMLAHLGATASGVTLWLLTRRRIWSARLLRMFDAAATVAIGSSFAFMGATILHPDARLIDDARVAMLTATLAVVLTMTWRATAVPSPPRRTAILSALGMTPLVIADFAILGGPGPAGKVLPLFISGWAVLTLVTSTVTSFVVYGLRRKVQRAQRLGQYTLEQKIGEGAMGVVYRATTRCCAGRRRSSCCRPDAPRRSISSASSAKCS